MTSAVVVAYVPVLHEGYRRFLAAHARDRPLWLIGPELHADYRPLAKDVRALPADDAAAAIRLIAERLRVIAEGAGALATAAAVSGRAGGGKIVCIVSGGNIDTRVLGRILAGETP